MLLQHISPLSNLRSYFSAPQFYSNTVSRETKSSESNLQTMVKLTNFQQIAPSHVQPLFYPLLYIPCPTSGSQRVWTPKGNVALSLVMLRFIDGGEKEEKSRLYFPFSFRSVPSAFLTPTPAPRTHGETQAFIVLRYERERKRERE